MNPKKFALWLFMVSITMAFAALTSAYIVKKGDGQWLIFEMPSIFYYSTAILLVSSGFMHWAYLSAKKDNIKGLLTGVIAAVILGIVFLIMQVIGWGSLVDQGVYLVGNPAGSFMYILTGFHGLHLISGIIFLIIVLFSTLKFRVHSRNLNQLQMSMTYWHFLDAVWIYLFVFLLINN